MYADALVQGAEKPPVDVHFGSATGESSDVDVDLTSDPVPFVSV